MFPLDREERIDDDRRAHRRPEKLDSLGVEVHRGSGKTGVLGVLA